MKTVTVNLKIPHHGFGSRQLCEIQCLYENLTSNNFFKMAVLKKKV